MYNSTHTHLHTLLSKKSFTTIFAIALFLFPSVCSFAQSSTIVGSTPLIPPQQFTSNLIAVNVGGNVAVDGNIAILDNTFSNAVDAGDGIKTMHSTNENFDLLRNGIELVLEQRKLVVTTDTLFFAMSNLKAQNYLLEFYPLNMNIPGLTAVLVDKYLNVRTPVNLNFTPVYYPFLVSSDAGSFASDRFMVIFFQADLAPLPVNFISIAANKNSNGVQVNWTVAAERGIVQYSIEKSVDGRIFNTAGTAPATAYGEKEKVYSWLDSRLDAATLNSNTFYRIKSIGINGDIKYSSIIKFTTGSVKSSITISPNPIQGNRFTIQFSKSVIGRYNIMLLGIDGKLLYSSFIQHPGDNASFPLQLPAALAKGTYILNVISPDKTRQSQVVVIGNVN